MNLTRVARRVTGQGWVAPHRQAASSRGPSSRRSAAAVAGPAAIRSAGMARSTPLPNAAEAQAVPAARRPTRSSSSSDAPATPPFRAAAARTASAAAASASARADISCTRASARMPPASGSTAVGTGPATGLAPPRHATTHAACVSVRTGGRALTAPRPTLARTWIAARTGSVCHRRTGAGANVHAEPGGGSLQGATAASRTRAPASSARTAATARRGAASARTSTAGSFARTTAQSPSPVDEWSTPRSN